VPRKEGGFSETGPDVGGKKDLIKKGTGISGHKRRLNFAAQNPREKKGSERRSLKKYSLDRKGGGWGINNSEKEGDKVRDQGRDGNSYGKAQEVLIDIRSTSYQVRRRGGGGGVVFEGRHWRSTRVREFVKGKIPPR